MDVEVQGQAGGNGNGAELLSTTLTITLSDDTPIATDAITIFGYIVDTLNNVNVAGKPVHLFIDGEHVETVITDGSGAYAFYNVNFFEGNYAVYTHFPGDATYLPDDSPARTVSAWRPTTSLTIGAYPITGDPPFDVTVSGKITRDDTNAGVGLRIKLFSNDVEIASKNADSDGTYSFGLEITDPGTFVFHTKFDGTYKFQGCKGVILPCPLCRHPVDATNRDEVACQFCGSVSEVVPLIG